MLSISKFTRVNCSEDIISTPILFWGSRYVSVMADYVNKATQAYSVTDLTSLCFPSSEELSFHCDFGGYRRFI